MTILEVILLPYFMLIGPTGPADAQTAKAPPLPCEIRTVSAGDQVKFKLKTETEPKTRIKFKLDSSDGSSIKLNTSSKPGQHRDELTLTVDASKDRPEAKARLLLNLGNSNPTNCVPKNS